MIETDKRKAVFLLHQEGHSVREIARLLSLSRNTVRSIIAQGGAPVAPRSRADKLPLDEELLRALYQQCQGHIARVHEKLVEEHGVAVVPGAFFSPYGGEWIRFSYATPPEKTKGAAERLLAALKSLEK